MTEKPNPRGQPPRPVPKLNATLQQVARTVRVKPHSFQPRKAELEAPIDIRKPDGTAPTPDELAEAVLRPVRIVEDSEA